jgi:uncharacterized protein involved in type VI secretion and phage assembly
MMIASQGANPFDIAQPGVFHGTYLAEVISVQDPDSMARVQVRLLNFDGIGEQDGPIWARVAVPFAGADRGAFFIPDVGDEVLISFVQGDSRLPIVIGSMWNGAASPPETISGDSVDRWTFVGKAGTRIAIVEESDGQAQISLTTPNDEGSVLVTQESNGKIEIKITSGSKITIDSQGISLETPNKVKVQASLQASQVDVTAAKVNVDAALSKFSGVVKCDVLQATTVVATTYTPGAGNVW